MVRFDHYDLNIPKKPFSKIQWRKSPVDGVYRGWAEYAYTTLGLPDETGDQIARAQICLYTLTPSQFAEMKEAQKEKRK